MARLGLAAGEPGVRWWVVRGRWARRCLCFPDEVAVVGMGRRSCTAGTQWARQVVAVLDEQLRLSVRQVMWGRRCRAIGNTEVCSAGVVCRPSGIGRVVAKTEVVLPDLVMGHSVGEIAAAWPGRWQMIPRPGGGGARPVDTGVARWVRVMVAVAASEGTKWHRCSPRACASLRVNAPESTVIRVSRL